MNCKHCNAVLPQKPKHRKYCNPKCRNADFQRKTNRTHIKDGDVMTINGKAFYIYSKKRDG